MHAFVNEASEGLANNIFCCDEVFSTVFVCLFVCLFACVLLVCLLVLDLLFVFVFCVLFCFVLFSIIFNRSRIIFHVLSTPKGKTVLSCLSDITFPVNLKLL